MLDYLVNALVTLFVTIDPLGLTPVFAALTEGRDVAKRRSIALRATIVAGGVLLAFALVGQPLIRWLGISLSAFRISGGLLLFWIAFEMIFERRQYRKSISAQEAEEEHHDVAVFPLAIPMIAGPGAISATILLASQAPAPAATAGLLLIIVMIIGGCFGTFLLARQIDRLLGATGRTVLSRLLGVILAALSVQFVADGVMTLAAGMR